MTDDIEVLRAWIRFAVVIAAIGATSLPVIYAFSNWRARPLGRAVMLLAVTLAGAMNLSVLFTVWAAPNVYVIFWINLMVLTSIFISTTTLSWMVWRLNYPRKKRRYAMLFSGALYDFLKKVVQIVLPGLSTFYFTIAQIWDLMYAAEVSGTIAALALFLGLLLGLSSKTYKDAQPEKAYDGEFQLMPGPDGEGDIFRLKSIDMHALETKPELVFRVYGQRIEDIT